MVGRESLEDIKGAFESTRKTGSHEGRLDVFGKIIEKKIPPKLGHRAIGAMRKILEKKGQVKPILPERGMTRLDIELKTDLDLKGIPGPAPKRR